MSKSLVPDALGITWYVDRNDPLDLLFPLVELAESLKYTELVLPPELPRFGRVDPPDWDACLRIWKTRGDGPELRTAIMTNEMRRIALLHGTYEEDGQATRTAAA